MEKLHRNIVFFDGSCGLCNGFISFLQKHDAAGRLYYAPIQGQTFDSLLRDRPELSELNSMFLVREHGGQSRIYTHSDAALHSLGLLPWPWRFASVALAAPKFLRDPVYRLVARVRYWIFGKRSACDVPTPEENHRFLN